MNVMSTMLCHAMHSVPARFDFSYFTSALFYFSFLCCTVLFCVIYLCCETIRNPFIRSLLALRCANVDTKRGERKSDEELIVQKQ